MNASGPSLSRAERISAGPNVIVLLTTQLPSMTSIWNQFIPAAAASSNVLPSSQKSTVRMLGVTSNWLPGYPVEGRVLIPIVSIDVAAY